MKKPIKKASRSGNREASRRVQDRKKKQSTSKARPQAKKAKPPKKPKPPKASGKTAAQKRAELETRRRRARAGRLGWERRRAAGAKTTREKPREELQAQRRRELEAWRENYRERLERERFQRDLRESEREWKKAWRKALAHAEAMLGSSPHFDRESVKRRLKEQTFPFQKRYLTYSSAQLHSFASNPIRDGEINPFWYH